MKLPTFPNQFKRPEQSPTFSVHNVQLKKVIHEKFKVYFSIKNIFNRTQSSPIIDWENPFSDNFDTSYAYGPLQSRRLLAGISLKF